MSRVGKNHGKPILVAFAYMILATPAAFAQCWEPGFNLRGVSREGAAVVHATTTLGTDLYIGGLFFGVDGVSALRVAKWNGSNWSPLGTGAGDFVNYGTVNALAAYDDGNGPALYVGGEFDVAGGVAVNNIAKWNGASWSALGSGIPYVDFTPAVRAMDVFDDGSGSALYVGGPFGSAGGVEALGLAKWNGATWSAVGTGFSGSVYAITTFDDGGGPALYVGGIAITVDDGANYGNIAKWDGSSWSLIPPGAFPFKYTVYALASFDDGSGSDLFAGASQPLLPAGGYVAKWNGAAWSALDSGTDGLVRSLAVFDDGGGDALYATGDFNNAGGIGANQIAKWDGSSWSAMSSGLFSLTTQAGIALAQYDDGLGATLVAAGTFISAGGVPASNVAQWDGANWSPVSEGGNGFNGGVNALEVVDDGAGSRLYAYTPTNFGVGSVASTGLVEFDGAAWSNFGGPDPLGPVNDMIAYDDGGGVAIYVGGGFLQIGMLEARSVAKWNGSAWSDLSVGVHGGVNALAVFGSDLYVAGSFPSVGVIPPLPSLPLPAHSIARWNGSSWSAVGTGAEGVNAPVVGGTVNDMVVHNDGSGSALFVGGYFTTAGGISANNIAKWNGSTWSALGSGTSDVEAMAVFDDGSGPALYVCGVTMAGGNPVDGVARWKAGAWSAVGGGFFNGTLPQALAVYDDGSGPALFAGGYFHPGTGALARNIAKWNGTSWSEVAGGMDGGVNSLVVFDDGSGPSLFAGGGFTLAGTIPSSFIAKLSNPTSANACDDGNPCTDDVCSPNGCLITFNTNPCDDGDPETVDDACNAGNCVGVQPFPFGDVNHSGTVNLDDILCILRAFAGDYVCSDGLANADLVPCAGNGSISLDDILAVLIAFAGQDLCP